MGADQAEFRAAVEQAVRKIAELEAEVRALRELEQAARAAAQGGKPQSYAMADVVAALNALDAARRKG